MIWSTSGGKNGINRFDPVAGRWGELEALPPDPLFAARFNAKGDAVLVYGIYDFTGYPTTPALEGLKAAVVAADDPLPVDLTGFAIVRPLASGFTDELLATINDQRDAFVAWIDEDGPADGIDVAHHSPSSGWHEMGRLPMPGGVSAGSLRADIDDAGGVFLAWANRLAFDIFVSRYTPSAGWSMPDTLSDIFGLGTPLIIDIAVTSRGDAVCFFRDSESYAYPKFKYRRRPAGGDWLPLEKLLDPDAIGESNDSLRVTYNRAGLGFVAWREISDIYVEETETYDLVEYNFVEGGPSVRP